MNEQTRREIEERTHQLLGNAKRIEIIEEVKPRPQIEAKVENKPEAQNDEKKVKVKTAKK